MHSVSLCFGLFILSSFFLFLLSFSFSLFSSFFHSLYLSFPDLIALSFTAFTRLTKTFCYLAVFHLIPYGAVELKVVPLPTLFYPKESTIIPTPFLSLSPAIAQSRFCLSEDQKVYNVHNSRQSPSWLPTWVSQRKNPGNNSTICSSAQQGRYPRAFFKPSGLVKIPEPA